MTRTSARAKKSKHDVNKKKEVSTIEDEHQTDSEGAGECTDKENDTGSTNYDVEKIVHTRIFKGKRQYLLRWKGYSENSDTWENESALQNCKEILEAFKKEHLAEVNSEEEDAEENEEEINNVKGKKSGKKVNKNKKKPGKSSQKKIEDDGESEEESKEEKDEKQEKGKCEETPENEAEVLDGKKNSNKKGSKGNKRKSAKEPERSKTKKAKKDESDDESVTDGKDYEVEKILEVHTRKDGTREFLIRWKGYRPSDDTWEPEAHLDCQDLIERFMEKVDKAKDVPRKELRQRTEKKKFVPLVTRRVNQRNSGMRPCYQESYED